MTNTYRATAPNGITFRFETKRTCAFAIFLKLDDGSYHPHFAKTMAACKAHWGTKGVGLTRAVAVE